MPILKAHPGLSEGTLLTIAREATAEANLRAIDNLTQDELNQVLDTIVNGESINRVLRSLEY